MFARRGRSWCGPSTKNGAKIERVFGGSVWLCTDVARDASPISRDPADSSREGSPIRDREIGLLKGRHRRPTELQPLGRDHTDVRVRMLDQRHEWNRGAELQRALADRRETADLGSERDVGEEVAHLIADVGWKDVPPVRVRERQARPQIETRARRIATHAPAETDGEITLGHF